MSLYYTQKVLYDLNRKPEVLKRYFDDLENLLAEYELTEEEKRAFRERDIGLLYVIGVNGQLLMHFGSYIGMHYKVYREAMKDGVRKYGPVRAGIYKMTTEL